MLLSGWATKNLSTDQDYELYIKKIEERIADEKAQGQFSL
jgi:hypothetical protein